MTTFPLPYSGLKDYFNGAGYDTNPFFGRWKTLVDIADISSYMAILDIVNKNRYNHPYVITKNLTMLASYYIDVKLDKQIDYPQMLDIVKRNNVKYFQADTVEGPYLLVVSREEEFDTHRLAAEAYKTYAATNVPAIREPNASDRQVHWVWFRKSPTWKLTNEIILRAASWIELNPGFRFHLWTNLRDEVELVDFLSGLDSNIKKRYFDSGHIHVHYENEFREVLFTWFSENMPHLLEYFERVWFSKEKQDIVMKTDYGRNILLAKFGGFYADFNDLVCTGSVEPLLEAHAGQYFGVSDNTSAENASNYLLYAAEGNKEWLDIVKRCTETLKLVYETIHSLEIIAYGRETILSMIQGQIPHELGRLKEVFMDDFIKLYNNNHFIHCILVALHMTLGVETSFAAKQMDALEKRSMYGRYKPHFMAETVSIIRGARDEIETILKSADFEKNWRFSIAHIYLRAIMWRSNLPIFCRQQKIPLYLLPFSYLLRYSCLLSFVGHIGDGTSYGGEVMKPHSIRRLLGC
jgi:mannosyltransferase OCH1-like enzyme